MNDGDLLAVGRYARLSDKRIRLPDHARRLTVPSAPRQVDFPPRRLLIEKRPVGRCREELTAVRGGKRSDGDWNGIADQLCA